MKPSNSTVAGIGIGVPVAIIVAWIISLFGVVMPPEVQTALGAVLSPLIGYFFIGGKRADTEDEPSVGDGEAGFVRPLMLAVLLAIAVPVLVILPGCATTSSQTQLILETTTRMAVRRTLAESDRAVEKAENIRAVAERLQAVVTAESTILGLRDEVLVEIDRLDLNPLDRADAIDLVNLFAAILQEQYGDELSNDERLVKVREFLDIVLSTLPEVSVE